jgi:hypothetical protein
VALFGNARDVGVRLSVDETRFIDAVPGGDDDIDLRGMLHEVANRLRLICHVEESLCLGKDSASCKQKTGDQELHGASSFFYRLCAFELERRWNVLRLGAEFEVGLAAQLEFDSSAVDDIAMVEPGARIRFAVESDGLNVLV